MLSPTSVGDKSPRGDDATTVATAFAEQKPKNSISLLRSTSNTGEHNDNIWQYPPPLHDDGACNHSNTLEVRRRKNGVGLGLKIKH